MFRPIQQQSQIITTEQKGSNIQLWASKQLPKDLTPPSLNENKKERNRIQKGHPRFKDVNKTGDT